MNGADIRITVEQPPDREHTRAVQNGLIAFNRQHVPRDDYKPLGVFLRDGQGRVRGGLVGSLYWGALAVDALWMEEELQGQGLGSALLQTAEAEALRCGCTMAHLDTMSFQALGFYEKHGYTVFGELTGYPAGVVRYFLSKMLQPDASGALGTART